MGRKWTAEQRARQAALIYRWEPWERSTGAKTPEGKAKASRNAYKGGKAGREARLAQAVRELCAAWVKVQELSGKKRGLFRC